MDSIEPFCTCSFSSPLSVEIGDFLTLKFCDKYICICIEGNPPFVAGFLDKKPTAIFKQIRKFLPSIVKKSFSKVSSDFVQIVFEIFESVAEILLGSSDRIDFLY